MLIPSRKFQLKLLSGVHWKKKILNVILELRNLKKKKAIDGNLYGQWK